MSNAQTIAKALGGGKESRNGEGWVTLCPCHDDNHPSLSIKDGGDGGVIVHCHAGCHPLGIKDELRARGVLSEWKPEQANSVNKTLIPAFSLCASSEKSDDHEKEAPSYPWEQAKFDEVSIKNYLNKREIYLDYIPPEIRWGAYPDKKTGKQVNQIVCAASKPGDEEVYAVQRLFIDTDSWIKTDQRMLGPIKGRGVWFDRKGDMASLAVGEGVETCLSFMAATGNVINTIAALSANNMLALELPEETRSLYVLVDSDRASKGMAGQHAAYDLAQRFEASHQDRKAFLVTPDDSCFSDDPAKLDFNDLLQADSNGDSICERLEKAVPFDKLKWNPNGEEKMANEQDRLQPLDTDSPCLLNIDHCFDESPPPIDWVIEGLITSGIIGVLSSKGGVGKSLFTMFLCLLIASGRSEGPFKVAQARRVLMVNVEDSADDLWRRFYYLDAKLHFNAEERSNIRKNLFVFAGQGLVGPFMELSQNNPVRTQYATWLLDSLRQIQPEFCTLDTYSRLCGVNENDNAHAAQWLRIPESYLAESSQNKCSFLIIHHASKQGADSFDQSSARGASALIDNARLHMTLVPMSESDAEKHGVDATDYYYLHNPKQNYGRKLTPVCFRRGDYGVPEITDLNSDFFSMALDRLIELLDFEHPEGVNKRDLVHKEGGRIIRSILKDEYGITKNKLSELIQFGVEATRLEEVEDSASEAHNKPVLVRVRLSESVSNLPEQPILLEMANA